MTVIAYLYEGRIGCTDCVEGPEDAMRPTDVVTIYAHEDYVGMVECDLCGKDLI